MEQDVKRGPSRSSSKENALKKGNSSWKPASLNEFYDKEDGYRYRMARKDPTNLAKKAQEGWETVSGIQSPQTSQEDPSRIEHGKPLTSVTEGHDWILQRIPEDLAQGRDAYYNTETERRTAGLTAHIKKDLAKDGAEMHGEITISSRKGAQTV